MSRVTLSLKSPLIRNGYALIINSGVTSVLGLLFWAVAARKYTPEWVGLNSAAISAMQFMAFAAQLGLGSVLNRFIPTAGRSAGKLIYTSYLLSVAASVAIGVIFILGINIWTPALSVFRSTPAIAIYFVISIGLWSIFALQDSALIGLRQATWVPPENILFSIIKIGLLWAFAAAAYPYGIYASWSLPILLLIIPINLLIFKKLLPEHAVNSAERVEPIRPRQIFHFVAGDYTSSIIWQATGSLMPLLILQTAGPVANAHFYLPWMITYTLFLISKNMGMSLTAEAANDITKLEKYSYQTLVNTTLFLLPIIAAIEIGAPYILLLFGKSYAAEGVTLLRLMALSALPNVVTQLYLSIARVQRRVGAVLIVLTALSVMALGMSYIFIRTIGLAGSGLAWVLSQSIIAVVLLLTELRPIMLAHGNSSLILRLLTIPRKYWTQFRNQRILEQTRKVLPEILTSIPERTSPPGDEWILHGIIPTQSDMTVATLGPSSIPPVAILNLPRSNAAANSFRRQVEVLTTLTGDENLGEFRSLLPHLLGEGRLNDNPYWITQRMPGVDARLLFNDPLLRQRILWTAAAGIRTLHDVTGSDVIVDQALLERWVCEPVRDLQAFQSTSKTKYNLENPLGRVETELKDWLSGQTMRISWIHGDYWPANILVTEDGSALTGIIDWDQAMPGDLPCLDMLNLLISSRRLVKHTEIGEILLDLLEKPDWSTDEHKLLDMSQVCPIGEGLPEREMLLLYWLRHVRANLVKSKRYQFHPIWVAKNVEAVLSHI